MASHSPENSIRTLDHSQQGQVWPQPSFSHAVQLTSLPSVHKHPPLQLQSLWTSLCPEQTHSSNSERLTPYQSGVRSNFTFKALDLFLRPPYLEELPLPALPDHPGFSFPSKHLSTTFWAQTLEPEYLTSNSNSATHCLCKRENLISLVLVSKSEIMRSRTVSLHTGNTTSDWHTGSPQVVVISTVVGTSLSPY